MANKKHIVTGTTIDLRHFDINGKCKSNNDSIYDRNGFKQDGTYMETGEKYYKGYNAFGVDKDGKNKEGKISSDILFTQGYINAVMQGKRKEYIMQHYRIDSINQDEIETKIQIRVYKAQEMYPKLKTKIIMQIITIKRMIKQREQKIAKIQSSKKEEKAEIDKLIKENEKLRKIIKDIDPIEIMEK